MYAENSKRVFIESQFDLILLLDEKMPNLKYN